MEGIIRSLLRDHESTEVVCKLWELEASKVQAAVAEAAREREAAAREREAAAREREAFLQALAAARESTAAERSAYLQTKELALDLLENTKVSAACQLAAATEVHLEKVEALQAEIDKVRGVLGTRNLLEQIALELAPRKPTTAAIADAFEEPAGKFRAYLAAVAASRSVKLGDLVAAGKDVYKDMSSRVHHGESGDAPFEAESLSGLPTIKVLALAALFKFNKRKPTFLQAKLPSPSTTPPSGTPATTSPERAASGGGGGGGSSK